MARRRLVATGLTAAPESPHPADRVRGAAADLDRVGGRARRWEAAPTGVRSMCHVSKEVPQVVTTRGENGMDTLTHDDIRTAVRARYGTIADTRGATTPPTEASCCGGPSSDADSSSCCGGTATATLDMKAHAYGYSAEDTNAVPQGSNLGLGCGNPIALASLPPGDIGLDLGSGAGCDCFLAARAGGETGHVIGVDMTHEMLRKARANAAQGGYSQVEFRLGEIEHLPVADASVDVVISNCVLNLSPDKPQVWRDIARVLKPGGRVAVSDLALLQLLPPAVAAMLEATVGCVAGAPLVADTERMMREAGLVDIVLTPKPEYVETMSRRNTPLYQSLAAHIPEGTTPADYLTSLDITARKPA